MALIPKDKYPAQTISADAGWPHGKARNQAVAGDGTGTPLEETWINDLWGFLQQILVTAGVTPSGDPDQVGSSQYHVALLANALAAVQNASPFNPQNDVEIAGQLRTPGGARFIGVSTFENIALFGQPVGFGAPVTFQAAATFNGGFTTTNAVLHGTILSDAAIGQSAQILMAGAGRVTPRVAYAPDANTSYTVVDTDSLVITNTVLTNDRTYQLNETGATAGGNSYFEVRSYDTTNTVTIANPSAVPLVEMPLAMLNPYVAFTVIPSIVRLRYENDGLTTRWQVTEIIDPALTFTPPS